MYKRAILWLILLTFMAAACTKEPATAPTSTALSAAPTVPATETTVATRTATATPAPATGTPAQPAEEDRSETPSQTATAMAASRLSTVDEFISSLQKALDQRDTDNDAIRRTLFPVMHSNFTVQLYPAGQTYRMGGIQGAVRLLSYANRPEAMTFHTEDITTLLPDGIHPQDFYTGERPLAATVYGTGWGQAGTGEALLYLTRVNGARRWAGLAVSYDNFQPLPQLETVSPPPGLVYRTANQWWRVGPDGEARLLLEHPGPLSFNSGASRALYAKTNGDAVTIFELSGEAGQGISRTLSIEGSLMHGSRDIPWLDGETAVLMVMPPGERATQGSTGNLALLNVVSGELQVLAPELSIYDRPATTASGVIVYRQGIGEAEQEFAVWRAGRVEPLELSGFVASATGLTDDFGLFNPVLSPGETQLAGVTGGDFGAHTFAYMVVDLVQETAHVVHTFLPVPTDARLPWGIHWSPDGKWLALEPPTSDPLESGVWLVAADGSHKEFLGPGTASPIWLAGSEGPQLLFNATIHGETRLQQVSLATGDRVWLHVPAGSEPIH